MIAGGLGSIQAQQTHKAEIPEGALLIQLGGRTAYRQAAARRMQARMMPLLDSTPVQRGNPK